METQTPTESTPTSTHPEVSARGRRGPVRYTQEQRLNLLKAFDAREGSQADFCFKHKVNRITLWAWKRAYQVHGEAGLASGVSLGKKRKARSTRYTPEQKRQAVEACLKSGQSMMAFGKLWGVHPRVLSNWLKKYRQGGPQALEGRAGRKPGKKPVPSRLKDQIISVKREFPHFGFRKVKAFLARFRGIKATDPQIRRVVAEEQLPHGHQTASRHWKKRPLVRRFERSRPGELWQSDITSFNLARYSQKIYLVAFLDDYSRYIVSWRLGLRQTQEFVQEALLEGIQRWGKPLEVLTDQGRQYFAWRGKSGFQKLLAKQGIRHVVSRTHHPETLGKCERFWETVGQEFWSRAMPQDLTEAQERLSHFIAHYNHFRPHQGIGDSVPADRFFGVESQVRKAIEKTLGENQIAIALDEPARKPVFLVGQIGDQSVTLHGERGRLIMQTPEGVVQEVSYQNLGSASVAPLATEVEHGKIDDSGEQPSPTGPGNPYGIEETQGVQAPQGVQDQHPALPGEGPLGDGQRGGEEEGPRVGSVVVGALARPDVEEGTGGEDQPAAFEGVAVVPAGPGGPSSGAAETTQEATQGNPAAFHASAGGQSQAAACPDTGTSETEAGLGGTCGNPEGPTGQPGTSQG